MQTLTATTNSFDSRIERFMAEPDYIQALIHSKPTTYRIPGYDSLSEDKIVQVYQKSQLEICKGSVLAHMEHSATSYNFNGKTMDSFVELIQEFFTRIKDLMGEGPWAFVMRPKSHVLTVVPSEPSAYSQACLQLIIKPMSKTQAIKYLGYREPQVDLKRPDQTPDAIDEIKRFHLHLEQSHRNVELQRLYWSAVQRQPNHLSEAWAIFMNKLAERIQTGSTIDMTQVLNHCDHPEAKQLMASIIARPLDTITSYFRWDSITNHWVRTSIKV